MNQHWPAWMKTQTVALAITPELLACCHINVNFVVEPGEFEIAAGSSWRDSDLQKVILTMQ
jgi:hypothetical protein